MTVGYVSLGFAKEVWNRDISLGIACKKTMLKAMRPDENNIQSNADKCRFNNRELRSKDTHLEVETVRNASKGVW